jgi:hypothetical protein
MAQNPEDPTNVAIAPVLPAVYRRDFEAGDLKHI